MRFIHTSTRVYTPDKEGRLSYRDSLFVSAESIDRVRDLLAWLAREIGKPVVFVTNQIGSSTTDKHG